MAAYQRQFDQRAHHDRNANRGEEKREHAAGGRLPVCYDERKRHSKCEQRRDDLRSVFHFRLG